MTKNKKNATYKMFCNYPDALTLTDFANMLGISTKLASKLIKDGAVEAIKVGREYRIAKVNAIRYLMGAKSTTTKKCVVTVTSNPRRWTSPQLCDMVVSTEKLETEVS